MYEESKFDIFKTIECIFCNLPYVYTYSHFAIVLDHDQSNCRVFAVFITRVYWFNLMVKLCIEEDNN